MIVPNTLSNVDTARAAPSAGARDRATSKVDFRPDIEGLRAVAVVSVLLYHLEVGWAPGGFVGVEVFFVISGFLMTRITAREIETGRFSPWRFYERRIFRIWPAMFVVILTALAVGAVTMIPDDLIDLARSSVASALAVNNFLFWQQSGYFAAAAQRNVLLHLWSLAVEQQFYLTMPLLMLATFWRAQAPRVWFVVCLAILSLLLCILGTPKARSASFFLLPTRYWEFLLGGIVALTASKLRLGAATREATVAVGLVLIAIAVASLDSQIRFPGYWALLPCIGTALVIAGGGQEPLASRLLSTAPLTLIGRLSYSLYLWHWLWITFCRLWGFQIDSLPTQLSILAVSFVLSYLSWRFVEVPFRGAGTLSKRGRATILAVAATAIGACSVVLVITGGLPARLDPQVRALMAYEHYPAKKALYREGVCFLTLEQSAADFNVSNCTQTAAGRTNVLLWGDSHAAHYAPGMRDAAGEFGINVVQATYAGCAPIPARPDNSETCADFGKKIWALIARGNYDRIVLSANWAGYPGILDELPALVRQLSALGQKVTVIGPSLEFRRNLPILLASRPAALFLRPQGPEDWLADYAVAADRRMRGLFADIPRVTYIAPISEACHGGACPVMMAGGVPLSWDASHLTAEGSVFMAKMLLTRLSQIATIKDDVGKTSAPSLQ
jgi:peptidoglycan/LPS O-acetylase OafA/YrhL